MPRAFHQEERDRRQNGDGGQITTLLACISIAIDAASDIEMGFVIHVELPSMTVDRLSNVGEQRVAFRWLHHPVVRLRP
jgi:hypothetical protein